MNEREVKAEVWLPLTQGQVAVIDFEDFEKVRPYKWYAFKRDCGKFYAARNDRSSGKKKTVFIHQALLESRPGLQPDHRDGDGLNNRQENLRLSTPLQNSWAHKDKQKGAASSFRGVSWHGIGKKWRAEICKCGTRSYLGLFVTEEAAARAYDAAAKIHFGEFAQLNFPGE